MNVVDWLLDSDPAIRWQVLRDLTGAGADEVAQERAKVATSGWGAQLLALPAPENATEAPWGDAANAEWLSLLRFHLLRDLGVDPKAEAAQRVVTQARDNITWHWWDNRPFFHGEVEPCINGRVLAIAAYFGQEWGDLLERLLSEQMADGGWNCEQENGSVRGSFHSSINVLEGLLEVERAGRGSAAVAAARRKGEEYLLERKLARRLTTGEVANPHFLLFKFPMGYRYDVLRGLDYLRLAALPTDPRMAEGLDLVTSERTSDGRWNLDDSDLGDLGFGFGEEVGQPSRWITLKALRVLRTYP
ncbi:MAG: hypothetical protein ABI452_03500 [Candidatus Limnocylindrales bacterium]